MKDRDYRKQFDGHTWGDWTYKASDDTLYHNNGYYYLWDFGSIEAALLWISHLNDKKDKKMDSKTAAEALSELLGCPRLADAYHTTYNTRNDFVKKIIAEDYSICVTCNERFYCLTSLPNKM